MFNRSDVSVVSGRFVSSSSRYVALALRRPSFCLYSVWGDVLEACDGSASGWVSVFPEFDGDALVVRFVMERADGAEVWSSSLPFADAVQAFGDAALALGLGSSCHLQVH